jgi:hypothetical protein
MVDLDALEAAGIANARERAALIEYLDGLVSPPRKWSRPSAGAACSGFPATP